MKPLNTVRGAAFLAAAIVPGILFFYIPRLFSGREDWAEYYAEHVFPAVSWPFVRLSSLVPVSLTEILIVFSAFSAIIWLIWLIVRLARSKDRKKFVYRFFFSVGIIFSAASLSFTLMHGINYERKPLEDTLSLDSSDKSTEELAEVTKWLAGNASEMRAELAEDDNGCMVLSTSIDTALADADAALDRAAEMFPVLAGNTVLAKPVALSHFWSYTGITGMYFPFFGEANVNVDIPQFMLPITICHEVSHTRGIAREQDANLAGFLACISSERADFRYCAYQFGYLYCSSDLYISDPDAYMAINSLIPDSIGRDWNQNTDYWKQFEGPVEEASTKVNDTYLKANGQKEGVLSYSRVTDLIIDYYYTYVKDNADADGSM